MTAARGAWAVALVLAAGCGGGRATPREALESMRAALATHDAVALSAMMDGDSVSHRCAEVRERRAMLERGDDPATAMQGMPISADEIRRGSESDAASLLLDRRCPLFADAKWIGTATVVEEVPDGADAARIRLRGVDGADRDFWFHLENGRWCYDQFRHRVWH
jgi:hypothetical protein